MPSNWLGILGLSHSNQMLAICTFFFFFFPYYLPLTMLYVWIKYENYPLFNLLPTYLKQVCGAASV